MTQMIQRLLQRRYLLLQGIAVAIWLVIEIAGYGTGVLSALFHRPLTNTGSWRVGDVIFGSPPLGPHRLSKAERDAQAQRIAAAFGADIPKHDTLPDLRFLFQPRSSLCDWQSSNVAGDAMNCNDLKGASPLFLALLRHVHPKTETVILREITGHKNDRVVIAFFNGASGKPQILFDLSHVSTDAWDTDKGFVLKAYGGKGLGEIALGQPVDGQRIFVVDDPGTLARRNPACATQGCFARLLVYGYKPRATDSLGRPVTGNLADIELDAALEQRLTLFAAVRNEKLSPAEAKLDTSFKPDKFAVTTFEMTHLRGKLDAAMGAGTTDRALFSPFGYRVAFGTVYAFALDGRIHLIWDGGTPHRSLGTDAFVFRFASKAIAPVGNARGLYVLPIFSTPTKLTVHKAIEPNGKPWSDFDDFAPLITPLDKALGQR